MSAPQETQDADKGVQNPTVEDQETLQRVANLMNVSAKDKQQIEEEIKKTHKFWDNQPVPKICRFITSSSFRYHAYI